MASPPAHMTLPSPSEPDRPSTATVSAIVVAFNSDPARLTRCLSALDKSVGVEVSIILVDNGSSRPLQGSASAALAHTVLRSAHNGGFAAGVNLGLRHAVGSHVAVVNDDAVVAPDMLARCVAAIDAAGPMCVAAAPKVLFSGTDEPIIDSCGLALRSSGEAFSAGIGQPDLGQFDQDPTVLGPCMSAAVFRSEAFATVGLLDERYFLYYEDVDWALRALLAGHTTVFVPAAIATHEHAATTRLLGEGRRYRLVQRNLLVCATINLSARAAARVWAGRLVVHAKGIVTGPYRRERLSALGGALARLPSALGTRRHRRRLAVIADEVAFAFADGLEPFIEVEGYRPTASGEAHGAALVRLGRAIPPR